MPPALRNHFFSTRFTDFCHLRNSQIKRLISTWRCRTWHRQVPPALRNHFFMQAEDEVEVRLWEEHGGAAGTYARGGGGRGGKRGTRRP